MAVLFRFLIDRWRQRLAYINKQFRSGAALAWRLKAERHVLAFLLWRHVDSDYAEPPRQAEPLDQESSLRSSSLWLGNEKAAISALVRDVPENHSKPCNKIA